MLDREIDIRTDMANGVPRHISIENLSTKYKVARRTISDQYYKFGVDVANALDVEKGELAAMLLERKNRIYNEAMSSKKLDTALKACESIGRMAQIYDKGTEVSTEKPKITISEADYSAPLKAVGEGSEQKKS